MKEVGMIRSDSFSQGNPFSYAQKVLNDTVGEFVHEDDRIINIELKEKNGNCYFVIFVESGEGKQVN